jgi:hypothetical protein
LPHNAAAPLGIVEVTVFGKALPPSATTARGDSKQDRRTRKDRNP